MEHEVFEHPVTIIVGLGLPRQVNTVLEAYAILNEWPPSGRSTAHAMALKACKAALAGNQCVLTASCKFSRMFGEAIASFKSTLDRYTLAEITPIPEDFLGAPTPPPRIRAANNAG